MRRLLLGAFVAIVLVGAVTYWAGEQTEVVVLRTADRDGRRYETKMWAVDHRGEPWVRVANPQREWYRRLLENPSVELVRDGKTTRCSAGPDTTPATAAEVDAAFRAKYGLVDWWYGVLLRRRAIPVRLAADAAPAREAGG